MKRLLVSKLGKPKHMRGETDAMGRRGIILFEGVPSVKDQAGHIVSTRPHSHALPLYTV